LDDESWVPLGDLRNKGVTAEGPSVPHAGPLVQDINSGETKVRLDTESGEHFLALAPPTFLDQDQDGGRVPEQTPSSVLLIPLLFLL
jgi:hypothetical protein